MRFYHTAPLQLKTTRTPQQVKQYVKNRNEPLIKHRFAKSIGKKSSLTTNTAIKLIESPRNWVHK